MEIAPWPPELFAFVIGYEDCPRCKGTGRVYVSLVDVDAGSEYGEWVECPECSGEGNTTAGLEEIG